MKKYRQLTQQEITNLISQNCVCADWTQIGVKEGFTPEYITNTTFSGVVRMGVLNKVFAVKGGMQKHACINNAVIHNCDIGDNVVIENIHNYIANYNIGDNCFVQNVESIVVDGCSSFGNGTAIKVLNETGGREVYIHDNLSSHFAYICALYRHRPRLIDQMKQLVLQYAEKCSSDRGTIGANAYIVNVGAIESVKIGESCRIIGAVALKNGSINSNEYAPVYIGRNVTAENFILSSGAILDGGATIYNCFIGQACKLNRGYTASNSLFFSNSQGDNGEASSLFAGPYTVTHHKSTLLISGMFSFMNAGSGSNQSNHMFKLGPIHQGIVERGSKTASNSYVLWPAKVGPFSLIIGRHSHHFDTSDLPYSYLIENDNVTYLYPGINLKSVGTIRDAKKWPERDMRKDRTKLDYINFNLLSPYTIQKVFAAVDILKNLERTAGKISTLYTYQSCMIKRSALVQGNKLYDIVIHKFLGNSIIKRLEKTAFKSNIEIRAQLKPSSTVGEGEWVDLAGLIAPKSEVDMLLSKIEDGAIDNLMQIDSFMGQLHAQYYQLEWAWAWKKIQSFYDVSIDSITAEDVISIVEQWKSAVIGLDQLIYEDARKEFSLSFKTGFGADGNIQEQALDFESVRGAFDENPFVLATLLHIKEKRDLGNELINRLKSCC